MSEETRFNVIIPTRERADVLFHCLRTVVAQDYDNLNIIVSDNFSQDGTRDVVHSFSDPRITFINPGRRLSMSSNWEFGLSHVTDGYVTFLGDDDGLLPGALKHLDEIIAEYRPDAINAPVVEYNWPENGTDKEWIINIRDRNKTGFYSSKKFLDDLMSGNLTYADGPLIYHGNFAKISVINSARNNFRRFFNSQIPDVYSAVALSIVTEKFLRIQSPVALDGRSRNSGGSSTMHKGTPKTPFENFLRENDIPIHSKLGDISLKSLQLITFETFLQVDRSRDTTNNFIIKQMNLAVMLSIKENRDEIIESCHQISKINSILWKPTWRQSRICFWIFFVAREIRNELMGLRTRFTSVDGKRYQLSDVYKAACWVAESRQSLSSFRQKWSSFRYKLSRLKTL